MASLVFSGTSAMFCLAYLYKEFFVTYKSTDYFEYEFTNLPHDFEFCEGKYKSYYENAEMMDVFTYFYVTSTWYGFTYKNGKVIQNLTIGKEVATSISFSKSVLDEKPCVRIDFTDRYYEIRPLIRKRFSFLCIMRDKEINEILDVHILENVE